MSKIAWDVVGERRYETGVDHGVLYRQTGGIYDKGYAWNGLTNVTESPSGAEATPQYADNIKYLNLVSAEEHNATVEAFTYPREFAACDGSGVASGGLTVGQQGRETFGMSYRTKVGTDLDADAGFKLHLIWGALAAPSEKAFTTVNDSPEALGFSWELSTTPVAVDGVVDENGKEFKPTASLTIDSTDPEINLDALEALELILYGDDATEPRLPTPGEVISLFQDSTITEVSPQTPTFVAATGVITIPTQAGVVFRRGDTNAVVAQGSTVTIAQPGGTLVIKAAPANGYKFPAGTDDDNSFKRTA